MQHASTNGTHRTQTDARDLEEHRAPQMSNGLGARQDTWQRNLDHVRWDDGIAVLGGSQFKSAYAHALCRAPAHPGGDEERGSQ
jgi:hypothetical protein